MHVGWLEVDPGLLLRLLLTLLVTVVGLLQVVKNTASKYFEVDANFVSDSRNNTQAMPGPAINDPVCANCGKPGAQQCSRCKAVRYCSLKCQETHWKSEHKFKCRQVAKGFASPRGDIKASGFNRSFSGVALVPTCGSSIPVKKLKDLQVLFPYEEFVKLYNWNEMAFSPCGLINCGNSCFANVVLQCLTFTKPLVAYLLGKSHRRDCKRNDWCFICMLQQHVERASQSTQPFSPFSILSRLPSFGGNIGYGKQEDAHEFMRIVIDTLQSVFLDEFGGEKVIPTAAQETTLVQHIFGGHFQSQVMCTKCDNVSNLLENMMDLTVEIHGEAGSLEGCLDQFTVKERLQGDNMYKCDGCNEYVQAWKRLTISKAPNVLTIALKRFQSGRFGKLNKRVTFPEILDLSPYMSHCPDGSDVYRLYAVVVHVDMLNASFFGHYICYTKDFHGNWYRIDDCKVDQVELNEVLSQGAYMLLYTRISVRESNELQRTENANACRTSEDLHVWTSEDAQRSSQLLLTPCSSVQSDSSHSENGFSSPTDSDDTQPPATLGALSHGSEDAHPVMPNKVEPVACSAVPMEVSDCEDDHSSEVDGKDSKCAVSSPSAVANSSRTHSTKRVLSFHELDIDNGGKRAEVTNGS